MGCPGFGEDGTSYILLSESRHLGICSLVRYERMEILEGRVTRYARALYIIERRNTKAQAAL